MALKTFKLRLPKKTKSEEMGKTMAAIQNEETEVTLSEEDETKYGYNSCGDDDAERSSRQDRSAQTTSIDRDPFGSSERSFNNEPNHHTSVRRRSSIKGKNPDLPIRRRHTLTFSNDVTVKPVVPTQEMVKDKSRLWFEVKDYEMMQKKIFLIADRAKEGREGNYCTRGLESIIRSDSVTRRYASWDAVLDEQEIQWDAGKDYSDEAVAKNYRRLAEACRAEATVRGKQDAQEVEKYLKQTRLYCRRMSM